MRSSKINRRQFLKLAGAASALAVPTWLGYRLLADDSGDPAPTLSPYAPIDYSAADPAPILILHNAQTENPFGLYLAEILRAEGLNCFRLARLADIHALALDQFDLVLLTEGLLTQAQSDLLETYVARGGCLIAMRPAASSLFGVARATSATVEGNLAIETSHPINRGVVARALQFHGTADHYRVAGAQIVAWLVDGDTRAEYPAVTLFRFGRGQAALWAFDLAASVALTRQGNPAWANQERDGREGIRAVDAFVGWMDLDRIAIPQADEQMRLLSRLIAEMLAEKKPLPRLWRLPAAAETILIVTGDSHASPATFVDRTLARVEQYGGTMSVYYTPPPLSALGRAARKAGWWLGNANADDIPSPAQIAQWRARGHEFTFHPYVEDGVAFGYDRYWKEFTGLGYGPVGLTVRTHRILWTGWVETARAQATRGVRMNLDYYHYGTAFQNRAQEWVFGFFTGSGVPMKFIDEQGRVLNVFQQTTQLVDEHLMKMPWGGGWVNLNADAALQVSRALLDKSLQGAYAAIAAQFHVDPFAAGGAFADNAARWLDGTLSYAAERAIPIWSAARWLNFTETRHDANFRDLQWDEQARRLTFSLAAKPDTALALGVMLPARHGALRLTRVTLDSAIVQPRQRELGGVAYVWVSVASGAHQVAASYE